MTDQSLNDCNIYEHLYKMNRSKSSYQPNIGKMSIIPAQQKPDSSWVNVCFVLQLQKAHPTFFYMI